MSVFLTDVDDKSHDFMETAFRNAGFNVKQFKDKDTALAWLLG
jgi:DNA-binding response OmpR family regulator